MDLNRGLPGETPIDDLSGLIRKDVRTVKQLAVVEFTNSTEAITKYLSRRPTKRMAPFTPAWMLRVHKELLGRVWLWAGEPRTTDGLNIGVPAYRIATDMAQLAESIAHWDEHGGHVPEQAAMIHHRAVWIHPFLNGNGRWARLLGQIWQFRKLGRYTQWPEAEIWGGATGLRGEYIAALKSADVGDYSPLIMLEERYMAD